MFLGVRLFKKRKIYLTCGDENKLPIRIVSYLQSPETKCTAILLLLSSYYNM